MMNFVLSNFVQTMKLLDQEISVCYIRGGGMSSGPPAQSSTALSGDDRARLVLNVEAITRVCRQMSLPSAENRLQRIFGQLNGSTSYEVMHLELAVLKQSIEDDIQYERFYHYPHALGALVLRVQADWAPTFQSFPSGQVKTEVDAGVDCYALGQPTAAIFHFMRVAEFGLRALARERRVRLPRNKPIEWGMWAEIINQIETAKKKIEQKRAGPKKDSALDFYSGAIAHFNGFKDQYRNNVMHVRKAYEPFEAEIAMRQVRDFMNKLSAKVGETTRGQIKWGL
jgi:hypothetical protein